MDTQNNTQQNTTDDAKVMDQAKSMHSGGHKMLFGILAYLGILVVIPLIVKKDDLFVKFHIKQGLVLLAISLAIWILSRVLGGFGGTLSILYRILNLAVLVLSIIGIINVVHNKTKELPFVGHLSKHIPL